MLNFLIRSVRIEDATDINEMRRMDGVRENTLGLFSERVFQSEGFIKGLSEHDHLLVAEVEESGMKKVVGVSGLHVNRNPRLRHSSSLGIMVHADYQGKGIRKYGGIRNGKYADEYMMTRYNIKDNLLDGGVK